MFWWLRHPYIWWVVRQINKTSKWTDVEMEHIKFFEELTLRRRKAAEKSHVSQFRMVK